MAVIAYSYLPVLEEILIGKLEAYFNDVIKWPDLYPNFKKIRINNEFPWVSYMNKGAGMPNLANIPELFPSITIVTTGDNKSPTLFLDQKEEILLSSEFNDMKALAAETGSVISTEALALMETHFETNDSLVGTTISYQKQDTMNIDITVDDHSEVKDRIYDFITIYLAGHGNKELSDEYNINIIGESIQGTRSGVYNTEFGRLLRGATIQFRADYKIAQTYYYTDSEVIASVELEHETMEKGE